MLFDTTFFIDLAHELQSRGKLAPDCQRFLRAQRHQVKYVNVVTMGEFAVGASVADTIRMFRGYQRFSLGRELALFAGRLQARLPFEMGENDLWIAATALVKGLPLVSRDQAFAAVPGLTVIRY